MTASVMGGSSRVLPQLCRMARGGASVPPGGVREETAANTARAESTPGARPRRTPALKKARRGRRNGSKGSAGLWRPRGSLAPASSDGTLPAASTTALRDPLRGHPFRDDLRAYLSALWARPARSGRGAGCLRALPVRRLTEPFGTAQQSRRPPESDATERPPRDRLPSACMTRCARGSSPEGSSGRGPWLGIDVKDYFLGFFR